MPFSKMGVICGIRHIVTPCQGSAPAAGGIPFVPPGDGLARAGAPNSFRAFSAGIEDDDGGADSGGAYIV